MSKRTAQPWAKKKVFKKKKTDPLDKWAIEGRFKPNVKRDDTENIATVFTNSATGPSVLLVTISQGPTEFQRISDRVRIQSITIRGFISTIAASVTPTFYANDYLRLIIYYDRQTNGAATTFANVIQNNSTGSSNARDPPNWTQRGRYKILRDYHIPVPNIELSNTGGMEQLGCIPTSKEFDLQFYKNCKGKLEIMYATGGSGISDIEAGSIGVVCQCFQPTSPWQYQLTCSVEFMDV